MKAVILAAGKGTRLGDLTKDRPKPMIFLNGVPILEYAIRSIPASITEVVIVIGYQGDKIRNHFGNAFDGRTIRYVNQGALGGTAGALWSAKDELAGDSFLVIQGDDIHLASELQACMDRLPSYGIHKTMAPTTNILAVDQDLQGNFRGWHRPAETELATGVYVTTGTYVLDQRIFQYEPVALPNGEFGLPQTILAMSKDHPVAAVAMDHWLTVTYPQDIVTVERSLTQIPWHSQ